MRHVIFFNRIYWKFRYRKIIGKNSIVYSNDLNKSNIYLGCLNKFKIIVNPIFELFYYFSKSISFFTATSFTILYPYMHKTYLYMYMTLPYKNVCFQHFFLLNHTSISKVKTLFTQQSWGMPVLFCVRGFCNYFFI